MCVFVIRGDLEEKIYPKRAQYGFVTSMLKQFDRTDNEHTRHETKLHLSGNFGLEKSVDVQGEVK